MRGSGFLTTDPRVRGRGRSPGSAAAAGAVRAVSPVTDVHLPLTSKTLRLFQFGMDSGWFPVWLRASSVLCGVSWQRLTVNSVSDDTDQRDGVAVTSQGCESSARTSRDIQERFSISHCVIMFGTGVATQKVQQTVKCAVYCGTGTRLWR